VQAAFCNHGVLPGFGARSLRFAKTLEKPNPKPIPSTRDFIALRSVREIDKSGAIDRL
jgi:hypothetical protein